MRRKIMGQLRIRNSRKAVIKVAVIIAPFLTLAIFTWSFLAAAPPLGSTYNL